MKSKKGGIALWLLVIIVIAIVAAAAYWYGAQHTFQLTSAAVTQTQIEQATNTPVQGTTPTDSAISNTAAGSRASFTVSPISGSNPLTVTMRFKQGLGNVIDLDDTSDPLSVSGKDCSNGACAVTHTYEQTGTYTINLYELSQPCTTVVCFDGSTPTASATITVTGSSNGHPSVTLNQNGASFPASSSGINHFTLSGSASGTSQLIIIVAPATYSGATDFNSLNAQINGSNGMASGVEAVTNGKWSGIYTGFPSGTYKVYIFDYSNCVATAASCSSTPPLLIVGTVTVE